MSALTNAAQPGTPQQAAIAVALVVLERMGLSAADLAAVPRDPAVCRRSPADHRRPADRVFRMVAEVAARG